MPDFFEDWLGELSNEDMIVMRDWIEGEKPVILQKELVKVLNEMITE